MSRDTADAASMGFRNETDIAVYREQQASTEAEQQAAAAALAVARVAWEVARTVAISFGDFSKGPWESRSQVEQDEAVALVTAYLNTPSMTPATLRIKLETQQDRAVAYAFFGAVRGIAQEQTRT